MSKVTSRYVYVGEVVARHQMPIFMVFNKDIRFMSQLYERCHEEMGTQL